MSRRCSLEMTSRLRGRQHSVLRRYQTVPILALDVGPDALAELEAAFPVEAIVEDRLHVPQLAESVPLIEGDLAWTQRVRWDRHRGGRPRHRRAADAPLPLGQGRVRGVLLEHDPGAEPDRVPEWTGGADGDELRRASPTLSLRLLSRHARRRRGGRGTAPAPGVAFSGVAKGAKPRGHPGVLADHSAPLSWRHRRRVSEPGSWTSSPASSACTLLPHSFNIVAANLSLGRPRPSTPCPARATCRSRSSTPCARPASRPIVASGNEGPPRRPRPRRPACPRR